MKEKMFVIFFCALVCILRVQWDNSFDLVIREEKKKDYFLFHEIRGETDYTLHHPRLRDELCVAYVYFPFPFHTYSLFTYANGCV